MSSHENLYSRIHKAIRGLMSDTLVRVGRMDALDACEVTETVEHVRELLEVCRSHLRHENTFVHPAIERAWPGACTRVAEEHIAHEREIDELTASLADLETATGDRTAAAAQLYAALAHFVGENFLHMQYEETEHNALLVSAYTPAELMGIERAIVASLTPRESELSMRLFLRYLSPAERAELLRGMRPAVPEHVFGGVLQLGRGLLSDREWFKLQAALAA